MFQVLGFHGYTVHRFGLSLRVAHGVCIYIITTVSLHRCLFVYVFVFCLCFDYGECIILL